MKRFLLACICLHLSGYADAQSALKSYFPASIIKVDLSKKRQIEIERQNQLLQKEKLSPAEKKELDRLLHIYDETVQSVWDVIEGGCSWYCSGGNYKVAASSYLKDTSGLTYPAANANDLSYKTAWAEGKPDEGLGEYLEYFFKNGSPQVTTIIVSNGYMKSDAAWINNNRVKKLKFSINGKPVGILHLEDSKTDQLFNIGTISHTKDGKDLVLRFEILEVYKGAKYNDTVITEIYFDGIGVH